MRRTIWIILAVSLVCGLILFIDPPIGRWVDNWVPRDLQRQFSDFSKNGIILFYAVFGGIFGYAQVAQDQFKKRLCGAYLKAQVIFSFALVRLLKIGIGRSRPANGSNFDPLTLKSEYNSFPSGHAADIFTGAVLLYLLIDRSRWRHWRFLPLLYAGLVALTRIAGGVHHLADVVAGAAIGIGGALFFYNRTGLIPRPFGGIIQS